MLEFKEICSSSQSKITFVIILALVFSFYFVNLYSSNRIFSNEIKMMSVKISHHVWMPMTADSNDNGLIYSAYHETRNLVIEKYIPPSKLHLKTLESIIRVICIMNLNMKKMKFQCHFKYFDGSIESFDALDVIDMGEYHDARNSGFFILCPVTSEWMQKSLPQSVGVTRRNFVGGVNFIRISYPKNNDTERNIAVCPGPVFSSYDNALRIAEFIEIYKILGVSKFYIYNASISENVVNLLNFYEYQGTVEYLPWNIADVIDVSPQSIHYNGIVTCLNDCFYQATLVDNFKYFIHTDFDEIIFPHDTKTLTEFLIERDQPIVHTFLFYNYFFFYEYGHDLSNVPKSAVNKFLYTQAQVTRMLDNMGEKVRTKYIAKGEFVTAIGNHFIWKNIGSTQDVSVDPGIAFMHHYRDSCAFDICNVTKIFDNSSRRYADELWMRVDDVCGRVFKDGKCPLAKNTIVDLK